MDDDTLLVSLVDDVSAAGAVLRAAPEAPIVHCPGWTVTDLVRHHGDVLRWAETIVRTGEACAEEFSAPPEVEALHTWYLEGAHRFAASAAGADRVRRCWTFGRPPGQVWFWTRRQALEAAVHRWDAERAAGSGSLIAPEIAVEGVTEVVDSFFPRQLELERTPRLSGEVQLRATDVPERWRLTSGIEHGPSATIDAPVAELFLLLWGRADLDDPGIHFAGPPELAHEMRAARITP